MLDFVWNNWKNSEFGEKRVGSRYKLRCRNSSAKWEIMRDSQLKKAISEVFYKLGESAAFSLQDFFKI